VVVLLVPTTAPEDIASFANRVGNSWKIGRRGVGDGVLIVVAKDDRRMRIEVAKALEGAIPDIAAARIIDTRMKPRFRTGDYAGGLQAAVQEIAARIAGEPLPAPAQEGGQEGAQGGAGLDGGSLLVLLFVLVSVGGGVLRALFGTTLGAVLTGAAAGVLMFWFSASLLLAVVVAVLGFFFALALAARGGITLGPPGGGWGGGGWGGGSGGGFSSGGGATSAAAGLRGIGEHAVIFPRLQGIAPAAAPSLVRGRGASHLPRKAAARLGRARASERAQAHRADPHRH